MTAPQPLPMTADFLAMVQGIRELHHLAVAGNDDSPEADVIRDGTDKPWEALSEAERNRVRGLSEDLYSLVEPPQERQPTTAEAEANFKYLSEAMEHGEWDKSLELLRQCQMHLDPAQVSQLRGKIWLDAGDRETASLFFKHAVELDAADELHSALSPHSLGITDTPAFRK